MKSRKKYYDVIMGNHADSFRSLFERRWTEYIDHFPTAHKGAKQLRIGNRLRPCMVCWGYALATDNVEEMNFEEIIDLAIGIELIHKGSIIIDDYIDDDSARRGEITFHKQYSPNEAIMFLLFLLGKAIEKLSKFVSSNRVAHLICAMSESALRELQLTTGDFFEAEEIDRIVKGETVALIKDSLLFGYEIRNQSVPKMNMILENVATKCAYSFQLLNDLEPFTAINQNIQNKHNHNFDFEKNRKNLIISRLYQCCSLEDKEFINSHINDCALIDVLLGLMGKYHIENMVFKEVEQSKKEILEELNGLNAVMNNKECLNDFLYFINSTINICYLRVERTDE